MPVRHEYRLILAEATGLAGLLVPAGVCVRGVSPADTHHLADLMLDAYRNTLDYEGEGLAEAVAEVESYFSRASLNPAISQYSLALDFGDSIAICVQINLNVVPAQRVVTLCETSGIFNLSTVAWVAIVIENHFLIKLSQL